MDISRRKRGVRIPRKAWPFIITGAIAVAGGVVILTGPNQLGSERAIRADGLTLAEVELRPFQERVRLTATVTPENVRVVEWPVSGTVTRLPRAEGDLVAEGDVLAVLQSEELERSLRDARNSIESARFGLGRTSLENELLFTRLEAQAAQDEVRLASAEAELARLEDELRFGSVEATSVEDARRRVSLIREEIAIGERGRRAQERLAALELDRAESVLANAEQEFNRIEQRLGLLSVRAPSAGRLLDVEAVLGRSVGAGAQLGRIVGLEQRSLRASVSEFTADRLEVGMEGLAVLGEQSITVRIVDIGAQIDEGETDLSLQIAGEGSRELRLGDRLGVEIIPGDTEEALLLPRGDFFTVTGGRWIYRLVEGEQRAERVFIRLGRQNDTHYEVLEGLEPGDRVIVGGYDELPRQDSVTLTQGAAE
jgi:multidrug efflux pump subunit AcrA (membrane-fusion protein)